MRLVGALDFLNGSSYPELLKHGLTIRGQSHFHCVILASSIASDRTFPSFHPDASRPFIRFWSKALHFLDELRLVRLISLLTSLLRTLGCISNVRALQNRICATDLNSLAAFTCSVNTVSVIPISNVLQTFASKALCCYISWIWRDRRGEVW